jgi:two-component system, OmpR family, alkaline phosphatase synthesis response regulator PhoP
MESIDTMSETILICDDELFIVRAVSLKLANAGYQTVTACDGAEALELASQERPDMVITDCQMPCMNGIELCAAMKKDPALCGIPVIMLTGKGFEFDEAALREQLGVQALLSKPFSPRELLGLVTEVLQQECPVEAG